MLNDMSDRTNAGINKRVTLTITAVGSFVSPILFSSINVALPSIGREFAMEAVLLGWVANSYNLASAAFLVPLGRLADIYGRKKIFTYGFILLVISSFLCAVSNSAIWLISFRVLQGISSAMIFSTAVAILTSVFPAEERGKVLGINTGAVYLGLTLGPLLGGVMTQHLGWRSIFFFVACLGLVVAVIIFRKMKGEWAEARGEKFDITGSVVFGISLVVLMYGFTMITTRLGIILFVVGMLGMLGFVRWEARVESPVFNINLFRKNLAFVFSNLAALINYSAISALSFLLSLYLQYVKAVTPQTAGLIFMTSPVFMTILTPIAGRLSDRIIPQKVASAGMALNFLALLMFVFLANETAMGLIIAGLVIFGLGMGFFSSPNMNAIMSSVEKKFLGVASGTVATMRTCGQMLSMGIVMILFSVFIGQAQITPEYYPAFLTSAKVGFIICAALCFGGIFAQLMSRRARTKGRPIVS
jgi:EmrB/QacA subfamily drug resistance transporter